MKKTCLFFLCAFTILACHSPKKSVNSTADTKTEIVNKYWKLLELNGERIQMSNDQERETHLILRQDGSLSGHSGCNSINGSFELNDKNRILFKNRITTLRSCEEVPYEAAFNNALHTATRYTFSKDTMRLQNQAGITTATFIAVYLN